MQTTRESQQIETLLKETLEQLTSAGCPPRLAEALWRAVVPGGRRLRPLLCLEVSRAVGGAPAPLAVFAGAAIELMHCASLVHDDLPCFDNAPLRRGLPSVHSEFGEAIAVLVGDALIMAAFALMAQASPAPAAAGMPLIQLLARAGGAPAGITSGQAWELEPEVEIVRYHRLKTGALFEAATISGALTADPASDVEPWRLLGQRLGEAYQILDDIRDVADGSETIGKPAGQDQLLGRPNIVAQLGLRSSLQAYDDALARAVGTIPPCVGDKSLEELISALFQRQRLAWAVGQ